MDMDNQQVALPSTSSTESPLPKYTFKHPFPQCFSIPYPIIKYMIQNPQSGKIWKKLIMSCKFFYSKYPVYPVESLEVYKMKCEADGDIFDSCKSFSKLWVYDYFSAVSCSDMSALTTKIFKCDLRVLHLFRQSLTLIDYQKLTSSGSTERLHVSSCEIKNTDGTIITADKFLENLKHLKEFDMMSPNRLMFQPDTVKKMVGLLNRIENMRFFVLRGICETFDFSSFVHFLMTNETIGIRLTYRPSVSAAYKEMVENVVGEIKKNPSLNVPVIKFF